MRRTLERYDAVKILLLATLVLAWLLPAPLHNGAPVDATVLVENAWHPNEHGSGVVVGHDRSGHLLIVTARHVALAPKLRVVYRDGAIKDVIARYLQPTNARVWDGDVAVLVVPDTGDATVARMASREPPRGRYLSVIGNPINLRFHRNIARSVRRVRVAWLNESDERMIDDARTVVPVQTFTSLEIACAGCAPGDSGAGVFDTNGRLVGIMFGVQYSDDQRAMLQALTGRYQGDVPSTAFVVPNAEIRPLLDAAP